MRRALTSLTALLSLATATASPAQVGTRRPQARLVEIPFDSVFRNEAYAGRFGITQQQRSVGHEPVVEENTWSAGAPELDGVRFYFAGQSRAKITRLLGEIEAEAEARNPPRRSPPMAGKTPCTDAAVDALVVLAAQARAAGANAVVDIASDAPGQPWSNPGSFLCVMPVMSAATQVYTARLTGKMATAAN